MVTSIERLHELSLLEKDILISHANDYSLEELTQIRNVHAHISTTLSTETGMALGDLAPSTNPELCTHEHMSLGVDCHSYMTADIFTQMRLLLSSVRSAQSRPIVAN